MAKLQAGQMAPDFRSTTQDGEPLTLADLKGERVILYFYPKDEGRIERIFDKVNTANHYQQILEAYKNQV